MVEGFENKMLGAVIFSSLSLIANIVGLAIPFWLYVSVENFKSYAGLWKVCQSTNGAEGCVSIDKGRLALYSDNSNPDYNLFLNRYYHSIAHVVNSEIITAKKSYWI